MLTIRASSLPRIMACPASAKEAEVPMGFGGEGSELGTAVHAVAAEMVRSGLDHVPENLDPYMSGLSASERKELGFLSWACFQAWKQIRELVRDPQVELELKSRLSAEVEMTGHVDLAAVMLGAACAGYINDWKTGYIEGDYWPQLTGYCWLFADSPAGAEMDEFTASITWARTRSIESRTFTRASLNVWREELLEKLAKPYFQPGDHCYFCPKQTTCDARRSLVRSALLELVECPDPEMTPEVLVSYYPKIKFIKQAIERFEAALKMAVKSAGGELAAGDGKVLSLEPCKRETLLATPDVMALLDSKFGRSAVGVLGEAAGLTIVKDTLLEEVGKRAAKGRKGKDKEEVLQTIRSMGAVAETHFDKMVLKGGK